LQRSSSWSFTAINRPEHKQPDRTMTSISVIDDIRKLSDD
jgi:hypothetical protein